MTNSKTFNFIKALINLLANCTDEVLELTSNYQNNSDPTVDISNSPIGEVTAAPATNIVPEYPISHLDLAQLSARTVYPTAINLSRG